MEIVTSMNLCDSFYPTVPPSPNRLSLSHYAVPVYSVPTSPTSGIKSFPLVYSDHDNFEFETSLCMSPHRGIPKQEPTGGKQNYSPMAFADELFYNGKVMPLKPPPCFQYVSNRFGNLNSGGSSPASPGSILKGPFRRWSFNKSNMVSADDFDPFMVALENVRNEARGIDQAKPQRRARSLSPLRSPPQWSYSMGETDSNTTDDKTEHKIPNSARRVRRKRSGRNGRVKPTMTTLSRPTVKRSESSAIGNDGSTSSRKGSKRFNIKKILFRSASEGRADCDEEVRPRGEAPKRPPSLENLSFKAIHKTHYNGQKGLAVQELRRKTLIPYRATCMLVCLGFGHSGLRDLN